MELGPVAIRRRVFGFLSRFGPAEVFVNVWPEILPDGRHALVGSEGELVSVSVAVENRLLERLLESLARSAFPLNPQIFHDASVVRLYPDGRRDAEPATIVEFPAYSAWLPAIRDSLATDGFDPASAWANNMLEQIHSECDSGPAPPGAPYSGVLRYRRLMTAA